MDGRDLLTKAGWTAKTSASGTQALRFVNGQQLADVFAAGGRYALQVRSDCTPVTDAVRDSLPPAETIAGTLAPATSAPNTPPSGL